MKEVIRTRKTEEYQNFQIAIRGGRHSYIGASTVSKGVVVDVSRFNYVSQLDDKGLMTVGAGITLGELYYQLWDTTPKRLLYPGGTCPTVGLSGLTLGGGQGIIGRRYGLSVDQVVEIQMVNSTGDVMIINETSYDSQDLFWALRGGGNGNFGIVYQFTLMRYEIPEVNTDYLIYFFDPSDWHAIIKEWQELITSPAFKNYSDVWTQLTVTPTQMYIAVHTSGTEQERASLNIESLANVQGTTPSGYYSNTSYIECSYAPNNYSGCIAFWAGCTTDNQCGTTQDLEKCRQLPTDCGGEPFRMNSGYQSGPLSDDGIQTIINYILQVEKATGCQNASIQLDTLGGMINKVAPDATAFPHRNNTVTYQFLSYFVSPCNETAMIAWQDAFYKSMSNYMSPGAYRNYANLNLTNYNERYFLQNLPKLENIKAFRDPNNIFSYSQSIALVPLTPSIQSTMTLAETLWHYLPYAVFIILIVILGWLLGRRFGHSHSDHPHQE